jgi:predicted ribosome quality control (RQC) complex YloA/Tae2 family protein
MKRFTSLDISAITRELRDKVVGLRIANVYDLGKKTYQLKLAKPDHKQYLVIESGVRLHTTKFQRERQSVPSVFCLKVCSPPPTIQFGFYLSRFRPAYSCGDT